MCHGRQRTCITEISRASFPSVRTLPVTATMHASLHQLSGYAMAYTAAYSKFLVQLLSLGILLRVRTSPLYSCRFEALICPVRNIMPKRSHSTTLTVMSTTSHTCAYTHSTKVCRLNTHSSMNSHIHLHQT